MTDQTSTTPSPPAPAYADKLDPRSQVWQQPLALETVYGHTLAEAEALLAKLLEEVRR